MSGVTNKDFSVQSRSSAAVGLRRSGYKVPGFPGLLGTDFAGKSRPDKVELLQAILRHKVHGLSFSPYVAGQSPGGITSRAGLLKINRCVWVGPP